MSKSRKKKIKQLRRDIEELDRKMIHAGTEEEWKAINAAELAERDYLKDDLSVLETLELEEQAQSFGVGVLPRDENWIFYRTTTKDGRSILNERGLELAKNHIIDTRFAYWKRWVEIVAPIASIIFSFIALLIAALALYMQAGSDPIIVVPPPR